MTGKQRSYLKSLANTLRPQLQIGKGGLTDQVFEQLEVLLEHEELVKLTVLQNSPVEAKEIVQEVLSRTGAEFVSQLGKKLTIYRPSAEEPTILLP